MASVRGEPRRVLFVNLGEDWIRGSEQVLLDLAGSLDRSRFTPIVWCNAPSLARACSELGVDAHLGRFGFFVGWRDLQPARYASIVRDATRLVRQHAVDIIHCNGAAPLQFCVPAGLLSGRPVLGHLHFDEPRRHRYAFLTHLAEGVVGVSQSTVAGLLEDGMDAGRVRVVHNGIDFHRFAAGVKARPNLREHLGIAPGAFVVGSVGSLIHRKGHDVLLRAMRRLIQARPCSHLLVAGDGPERRACETLAAELGIARQVHFLGNMPDPSAAYSVMDVFALATRSDAWGLVFIEAAHFGVPAVGTRIGGVPEAVLHDRTGLLVPPEDSAQLADALLRLASDPALRAVLGKQAMVRAHAEFGLPTMVSCFESIYAAMLEPRERPGLGWRATPYLRLLRRARPELRASA